MDDLVRAAREAEAVAYDRLPDAPEVPVLERCGGWVDGYEQGALAAARAIRALPRFEWRDRMPTATELKAHAEAHGRRGRGMWQIGIADDDDIRCVSVTEWPGYHPGGWTCTRPCTWDGTPVLWPEIAEVDRER